MDKLAGFFCISSFVLATGCTAPVYQSSTEQNTAEISFTSLSDDLPNLELRLRGKDWSVDRKSIRVAGSDKKAAQVYKIPANEKIDLSYEVSEITDTHIAPAHGGHITHHKDTVVLTEPATRSIGYQVDFEQQYKINLCTSDTSFTAEKNKQYEIIVEQSDALVCRIYVQDASIFHHKLSHLTINKL